jgi:hypothetical protein
MLFVRILAQRPKFWTCSIDKKHRNAEPRTDMQQGNAAGICIHPLTQDPCISPCPVVRGSGARFPVYFGKGRKNREFMFFFLSRSALSLFSRSFLLRAREREKSAGAHLCSLVSNYDSRGRNNRRLWEKV